MSKIWHLRKQENGYVLTSGQTEYPCLIGKNGLIDAAEKREGDGATPKGCWPLRALLYRSDKIDRRQFPSKMSIPSRAIRTDDGWCDDANAPYYNQLVRLPFAGSHEKLWRGDGLYDVILPLGYNDAPPQAGKGSAIFLHCADAATKHTKGCLALRHRDLFTLLHQSDASFYINI